MQAVTSFLRSRSGVATALFVIAGLAILSWNFAIQPVLSAPDAAQSQPMLEDAGALASLDPQVADPSLDEREPLALPEAQAAERPASTLEQGTITAYITGAVRAPDVYTLPAQARIKDLVIAAGGPTDDADVEQINLAEHLKDEEHVHVPHQGDVVEARTSDAPPGTHVATGAGERININTASAAELEALSGIGKALSQRIIAYRMANGPFASVEDVLKVKGIGSALFDDIAPLITVGPN